MDTIISIIQVATPSVLTAFITYWFARRKVVPEKLEFAYSRIYYPLYRIAKDSDSHEKLLIATKEKIKRYEKHVSRTTVACCRLLDNHVGTKQEKKYYSQLFDDIYDHQHSLRISLGYLEPSHVQFFKYLSASRKLSFVFWSSVCGTIIGIYGINITQSMGGLKIIFDYIFGLSVYLLIVCIFIYIIKFTIIALKFVFSYIKKIFLHLIAETKRLFRQYTGWR